MGILIHTLVDHAALRLCISFAFFASINLPTSYLHFLQ